MSDLAFEVVDISEAQPESYKREKKVKHVPTYSGYFKDVELKECMNCGWCEDPEHCVWGIVCPVCKAEKSQCCRESSGRLRSLHQERWDAATS